jgi:hypothetical protein
LVRPKPILINSSSGSDRNAVHQQMIKILVEHFDISCLRTTEGNPRHRPATFTNHDAPTGHDGDEFLIKATLNYCAGK